MASYIMKFDTGTEEMRKISDSIEEGSEGFIRTQYGTIFKLSFLVAFLIMIIYYTRKPQDVTGVKITPGAMALFEGFSFILGAICSAWAGYAGMWVSVRANIRCASACKRCYNEAI